MRRKIETCNRRKWEENGEGGREGEREEGEDKRLYSDI